MDLLGVPTSPGEGLATFLFSSGASHVFKASFTSPLASFPSATTASAYALRRQLAMATQPLGDATQQLWYVSPRRLLRLQGR